MKRSLASLTVLISVFLLQIPPASAGLLDKLNSATQKLNEKTKAMEQKSQTSSSSRAGCENGRGGATCLDGLKRHNECFDPLKGYRAKLSADLIENKLKTQNDLPPRQRANLEEDLAALREAESNKSDAPTIAGRKNSSRYLMDITPDEQTQINTAYTAFYEKITSKCMGNDISGHGKKTETHYVKDNSQAMADRKQQDAAMGGLQECMKKTQGLRYLVIADTLEQKMNTLKLSDQEKQEWEEDIALVREAGEKNLMMPQSSDPVKAMRYIQRLTMDEQMAVNQKYSKQSQDIMADCSATAQKGLDTKPKDWSRHDGGLVDHSRSPANKNLKAPAKKKEKRKWVVQQNHGALSCYLGACVLDGLDDMTECTGQTGGYWWKVLAEGIEEKLKSDTSLSETARQEMQEDIDALHQADAERLPSYPAPDPSRSMRYQDWFNKKEFGALQMKHKAMYDAQMKYCHDEHGDLMKHN